MVKLVALLLSAASLWAVTPPALPQLWVDTTYPTVTGTTTLVHAGDSLQVALNAAAPGDELVLDAGATWVGNFILPPKANGYVIIRSSALSSLPPNTRVGPSQAASMAKIVSPNSSPAFTATSGANYYFFAGLEVVTTSATTNYTLVVFGVGNELSNLPHHLIVDRCFVHGAASGDGSSVKRGLQFNGAYLAVVHSYISDIHVEGQEAQAIQGWNGSGPFKVVNNYIEGAGENIMWGGADPVIPNQTAADIQIEQNWFNKPLSWYVSDPSYGGIHWSVKNLYESKNSKRVLLNGNIFSNNWVDAQTGEAIVLKSSNQSGACDWCMTSDYTVSNNVVTGATMWFLVNGRETYFGGAAEAATRIAFVNNLLFLPRGGSATAQCFQFSTGASNILLAHNTALCPHEIHNGDASTGRTIEVRDNIFERGTYGWLDVGLGEGLPALGSYSAWAWERVLLLNTSGASNSSVVSVYPSGAIWGNRVWTGTNVATGLAGAGFVNSASTDRHGFQLTPASLGYRAATDGKDLGVDILALDAALAWPRPAGTTISGPTSVVGRVQ